MFPQLGAPLGFLCSTSIFLLLADVLTEAQFYAWGWRVPFLASALLVLVGLYVRLRISETPAFARSLEQEERVKVPMLTVLTQHTRLLIFGTFAATATFVIFYLMTVFTLSWGTSQLGYTRKEFLLMQMVGVVFFAITIPISALLADRYGRRLILITATLAIMLFGIAFAPLFTAGNQLAVVSFLSLGMVLIGWTYGPLGAALAELFPTRVRYTGASLTFNLAGIFGASLAPYVATSLAAKYGLAYVGYYLSAAALVTLIAWIALGGQRLHGND
jgi:MFS family permease